MSTIYESTIYVITAPNIYIVCPTVEDGPKGKLAFRYLLSQFYTRLDLAPPHTDRHFISTDSCEYTTLTPPTEELGCQEIETNILSANENLAIFSRRKFQQA